MEFNIEEYEFSDDGLSHAIDYGSDVDIRVLTNRDFIELNKQDAIALAKHFKLTQEDLNNE